MFANFSQSTPQSSIPQQPSTPQQLDHRAHRPAAGRRPLCYVLQDIQVPENVGSLFRLADAFAVERLYLTGRSVCPPNRKLRKTSRATDKHVPFQYLADTVSAVRMLKTQGYAVFAVEITATSVAIGNMPLPPPRPLCLVLGAEKQGVSEAVLALCDHCVHIPMLGLNSSMNVSHACAIASYQLTQHWS